MSKIEASSYKNKVFDERVLQFCLSVVDFVEVFPANKDLLRRALLDAVGFCRSIEDLAAYLAALNSALHSRSKIELTEMLSAAQNVGKTNPDSLQNFLLTVNKLGGNKNFSHWDDFFAVVNTLAPKESQLTDFLNTTRFLCDLDSFSDWMGFFTATKTLNETSIDAQFFDFLNTTRMLSGVGDYRDWTEFFISVKTLCLNTFASIQDLFTTIRFLAPTKFPAWSSFYTACKKLNLSDKEGGAFFEAIRHSRHYFLTQESFQGILRALAETPEFSEALAFGQLDSKKWLLEEAVKVWSPNWGDTVFVLAGWVGLLPRMIYDQQIEVLKIRSFDVDASANRASESINQVEVQQDWAYKSSTQDITKMQYPTTYKVLRKDGSACELCEMPDVVINTSCEHIADINSWWEQIPAGTKVILQSNNGFHIPEHVACFSTLQDFAKAMQLSRIDYQGEKDLPEFKRFMLIGVK